MILFLIKGIVLGFAASVGLGAVTILVINRTFRSGRASGFISGFGSALSDTIYATIAFLGMGLIISFIESNQGYIRIFIMFVLLFFGVQTWLKKSRPAVNQNKLSSKKSFNMFASCFVLALSNPMMVIVYLGIFAIFPNLTNSASDWPQGGIVVAGIFSGALIWWLSLTFFLGRVSRNVSDRFVKTLNQISSIIILALALYSGISGIIELI